MYRGILISIGWSKGVEVGGFIVYLIQGGRKMILGGGGGHHLI